MGLIGVLDLTTTTDSIWSLKPWWCQPWSIVLTGLLAVAGSWWLLQRWWITASLGLLVLGWWALFLVLVPASYKAQLQVPPAIEGWRPDD